MICIKGNKQIRKRETTNSRKITRDATVENEELLARADQPGQADKQVKDEPQAENKKIPRDSRKRRDAAGYGQRQRVTGRGSKGKNEIGIGGKCIVNYAFRIQRT